MCGIIGIISQDVVRDRDWLNRGRDTMIHRGPDDAGEWWSADGRVGMGHRRLAIVDLSPGGHQPMHDSRGELSIVFNGEIYNHAELRQKLTSKGHSFRSRSDTEVILAAYREWGTECLGRLAGMFALVLYDQCSRSLFMARDRAGEKPLYYAQGNGTLRFASELKGLMADPALPRRIDAEALDCYLTMGFVPGERCILEGVRKLPPAHALMWSSATGQIRAWRYWHLPPFDASAAAGQCNEAELLRELEEMLQGVVRRQLVADVPVGVLLSGGVDSSLLAAMAVRVAARVRTFTIRFPGYGQYDETEHARLIAAHLGTEHTELDAGECSVDLMLPLARQLDEPVVDSSIIPTNIVSRLVREHCTVALGGDGGDELFGGYRHYNRLIWMKSNLGCVPRCLRQGVSKAAEAVLPVGFRGRNYLQILGMDFRQSMPLIISCFDRCSRRELVSDPRFQNLVAERIWEERTPRIADLLQRATRMDFENYLSERVLVKLDRASMLNSLEVRAPFLNYRLLEFAFGRVPSHLKATASTRKVLLKRLAKQTLPPSFDFQRKQGLSLPLDRWLGSGPWRTFFREVLLTSDTPLFSARAVERLFDGELRGRSNCERLFALVLFELWRREYHISI